MYNLGNIKVIILTGPSAVGKATVEGFLFKHKELKLQFSTSATTRNPRDNEKEGIHYFFLSEQNFNNKISNDEFVEYSEHFNHKYGTLKSELHNISSSGHLPFLEIDVNGAITIMNNLDSNNYVSIFLAPPSIEDIEKRLRKRSTESDKQIKIRLERVSSEMSYSDKFDFVVINDKPDRAAAEIAEIIIKGGL